MAQVDELGQPDHEGRIATITLMGLNGATFTSHVFNPTFPSLSSPLGPLGLGAENFDASFAGSSSEITIAVAHPVPPPILQTAGDILNAVASDGLTRTETETATSVGVNFTQSLSGTGTLAFDLTNFAFDVVPEVSQLCVALGACAVGAIFLYRSRRSKV